jgi:D-arabinose 1-dehydrogenase-like Zn-dependent alcohol dehydrogenase
MAGVAVRESATFAGRADQVREARAFVGRLLGSSHPCGDVAVLLASEVVTNCVLHGGSSAPGEAVTVTVVVWDAGVRVEAQALAEHGVKAEGNEAAADANTLQKLAELVAEGKLEVPIAASYPLSQVQDAFRELEQGHTFGKIVLIPYTDPGCAGPP